MNAILLSGWLKAYRDSFPEFVKLVVKPANADVFCLFKRNTSWDSRDTCINDNHDEEKFIRECLGKHLKVLKWIDVAEETETYMDKGADILNSMWLPKYGIDICSKLEHWMSFRHSVDQYQRLRLVCREMINYSKENNIEYKRVLRARPDILPINGNKNWHLLDVNIGDIFINPGSKYEMRDILFVTDQKSMHYILENFPDKYLHYMPTTGITPHVTILSPECQLMQFMVKMHKFKFYFANFSPTVTNYKINNKNLTLIIWPCIWNHDITKITVDIEEI